MKTTNNMLAMFGMFTVSYNVSIALHELGHVAGVTISGGTVSRVTLSPFNWSWTYYSANPRPLLAAWSGIAGGIGMSLLPLLILRVLRLPWPRLLLVLGIASLAVNGVYLIGGILGNVGDGAQLATLGVPKSFVFLLGLALIFVSMAWMLIAQPRFGVPYDASIAVRSSVIVGGIGAYLLIMMLYVSTFHGTDLPSCLIFVGGGFLFLGVVVVVGSIVGDAIGRICPNMTTVNMGGKEMATYVGSGVLVVLVELLVFGK